MQSMHGFFSYRATRHCSVCLLLNHAEYPDPGPGPRPPTDPLFSHTASSRPLARFMTPVLCEDWLAGRSAMGHGTGECVRVRYTTQVRSRQTPGVCTLPCGVVICTALRAFGYSAVHKGKQCSLQWPYLFDFRASLRFIAHL